MSARVFGRRIREFNYSPLIWLLKTLVWGQEKRLVFRPMRILWHGRTMRWVGLGRCAKGRFGEAPRMTGYGAKLTGRLGDRNRNVGLLKPMAESGYAVAAFEGTFLLLIIAS